jgi:UDP-GlcNAc:undecaprenyl-phosphate GlcNAc-1-phosphate transferase
MAIYAHNNWGVRAETVMVWFFIPVMDCLRLIIARMLKGHAPFMPDRNHFHHHLEDKLGKTQGLCIYLGAVGGTSLVSSVVPHLSLVCMVILTAFYFSFAWLAEEKSADAEEGSPDGNVLNFGMKDVNGNSR